MSFASCLIQNTRYSTPRIEIGSVSAQAHCSDCPPKTSSQPSPAPGYAHMPIFYPILERHSREPPRAAAAALACGETACGNPVWCSSQPLRTSAGGYIQQKRMPRNCRARKISAPHGLDVISGQRLRGGSCSPGRKALGATF